MFDFSDDEGLFLFIAVIITVFGGFRYYASLITIPLLGRSALRREILQILPFVLLAVTAWVLDHWSDAQVVDHFDYILLFLVGASAWLAATTLLIDLSGISIREDAIDRDNPAAMIIVCGLLIAISIIYTLANVGGGPTIWTTILPALEATLGLVAVILFMAMIGGDVVEAITVDRDAALAFRTGGALIGCGIVLGRAAGGTWLSWDQTNHDLLRFGWPAILIGVLAGVIHRINRPSVKCPQPDPIRYGLVPAACFIVLGLVAIAFTPHGFHPSQW